MPVIAATQTGHGLHPPLVRPFAKSLAVFGAIVPFG
jgi:hypothetical protein